jgi:hypothetical protein
MLELLARGMVEGDAKELFHFSLSGWIVQPTSLRNDEKRDHKFVDNSASKVKWPYMTATTDRGGVV